MKWKCCIDWAICVLLWFRICIYINCTNRISMRPTKPVQRRSIIRSDWHDRACCGYTIDLKSSMFICVSWSVVGGYYFNCPDTSGPIPITQSYSIWYIRTGMTDEISGIYIRYDKVLVQLIYITPYLDPYDIAFVSSCEWITCSRPYFSICIPCAPSSSRSLQWHVSYR